MPETTPVHGEVQVSTIGVKRDFADDPAGERSRATPPPPGTPRATDFFAAGDATDQDDAAVSRGTTPG